MFYVSEGAGNRLARDRRSAGRLYGGEFTTEREATIVDFSRLPRIPSLFEPIHDTMEYDPRKLWFPSSFEEGISKQSSRIIGCILNVPTQVVTEYLRGIETGGRKYRVR